MSPISHPPPPKKSRQAVRDIPVTGWGGWGGVQLDVIEKYDSLTPLFTVPRPAATDAFCLRGGCEPGDSRGEDGERTTGFGVGMIYCIIIVVYLARRSCGARAR